MRSVATALSDGATMTDSAAHRATRALAERRGIKPTSGAAVAPPSVHQPIRLGFLVDSLLSRYQGRLLNGAIRAAERRGAHVIGFQGSFLNREADHQPFDGSFLYELAGPGAVDGLVVVSNILASVVGIEQLRSFCARIGVPVVSVGELPGFPQVCIDSQAALTAAISHLVKVHGRSKLAFIRGNPGNPESAERERVFRGALAALGVPIDERLMLPGTFLEGSGASAIRGLFEQRGVDAASVDGVVAANDQMAVGAARELRALGLRVPDDVALIGFDDDDHARGNSPPLTTVAQPIERVGEVAATMLLDRLSGGVAPERVTLTAEVVLRRSCGCSHAQSEPQDSTLAEGLEVALARARKDLVKPLAQLVTSSAVEGGVDAVLQALNAASEAEATQALSGFERAVLDSCEAGLAPLYWEDVLNALQRVVERARKAPGHGPSSAAQRVERARLLMSDVAARIYSLERLYEVQRANAVRVLGSALACVRSLPAVAQAIDAGLPGLGVTFCRVCLFVEGSERSLSRTVAEYASSARSELLQDAGRLWRSLPGSTPPSGPPKHDRSAPFPTQQLFGPAPIATPKALDFLVYPLVFAERALGYVVFDAPKRIERAWLLENVAGHLSGAVYTLARADELREARALAERASAAKSEFVAMMSHEIRTPLTAIHGHLELCLKTALSPEQQSHVTRAQTSSRSLLRIVNDILDFSKIEAQRLELEVVPFALEEVLEQLSGTFAAAAARKNLELVFDVHPDVPLRLEGDALRISQILLNLVGNAIKFTEHGSVVVTMKRGEDPAQPGTIELSVRDTGIGMSSEELARIFSPFTQADSSMTRRYGGTGLGVSISKRLVEMMGGVLEATSTKDVGSLFRFCLTLRAVERPESQAPGVLSGLRVLVVEACQPQADALTRILGNRVEEVRVCTNGSAALSAFRNALSAGRAFDVVLVASALPDTDGAALIARFRRALSAVELTALALGPSEAEFWGTPALRQAGATATIAKPFHAQGVARAIARARAQDRGMRRSSIALATSALAPPERRLQGLRVLVAQDDPVGLELIKSLLEHWGASVTLVKNGREAVEAARGQCFALILLDLQMPELDGFGAARAIRADDAAAIIVALTASGREEDRQRADAAGMDAYIRTPLESAVLLEKLLQICSDAATETASVVDGAPDELAPSSRGQARPLLDARAALARVDGDQAIYRRLLQRFLGTHVDDAGAIGRALAEGDTKAAAMLAHTLSSAAANVGASQLQRAAQRLEGLLSGGAAVVADELNELERSHEATLGVAAAALNAAPNLTPVAGTAQGRPLALLVRARALIESHDTAAVECVQSLSQSLADHPSTWEPLRRLEASIEAYDFEHARLELDALDQSLASGA